MLIKFVGQNKSTWSDYLVTCVFAYNTSQQDSTKFTPFELMFGRQATLPIDINIQKSSKDLNDVITLDDIERLAEGRRQHLQKAKENISAAQRKQKQHYDKKKRYEHLGKNLINLGNYTQVQLKQRIQFDGINCGVYCLKVKT